MRWSEISKQVIESAITGSTTSGNVASLAGGFDTNGNWRSVYPPAKKKPKQKQLLIRRNIT